MQFTQILFGSIGILLYLLIPGIALSLAILPRRRDIGMVQRMGLSTILGTATVLVQYFMNKNMSFPINQSNTYMIMAALTLLGLAVWVVRLKMTPAAKKETSAGN